MPKLDQKPDPVKFSERLNEVLADAGMPERGRGAELSRLYKVSGPTAFGWLNGEHLPGPARAIRIAADFGVPFEWLYFGRGAKHFEHGVKDESTPYANTDDEVEVPLWGARGSSGHGALNDDARVIGTLSFKRRSLEKKRIPVRAANVFYVDGHSMVPRLHDGDAVLFNETDSTPRDGKIYVVRWNGHEYVKRLRFYGGNWHISSDNKSDPEWKDDKPISETDEFKVLGRVRWIGSWED